MVATWGTVYPGGVGQEAALHTRILGLGRVVPSSMRAMSSGAEPLLALYAVPPIG
jgi:hypothetical protein